MQWSTACLDWQERIAAGRSLMPCQPLFPAQAQAAMEVFRALRLVDVSGRPTIGEACRPWVIEFAEAIFGAYDADSGRRLIREFFLLVSKKNSKSTIAAGIMLTALIRNWRHSAEYLIVAPTIEIANNSFGPAADMVRADEDLSAILHVQDHYRTITHRLLGASLKVVAADSETVSGKKATGVLVDELWLFGAKANAAAMLQEAIGGLISRPEGFVIYLSTQSDKPPAGVFRQKLHAFRAIRDGRRIDQRSLGILYEFPKAMQDSKACLDPANAWMTNPNHGASVDQEWLEDELDKAKAGDASTLATFAAKHLNIEIGLSLAGDRWPGAEFWLVQADPSLTLETLLERSEVVVIGIDGGGLDDLLGMAVLGREKETRRWLSWCHAWAHDSVLERRKSEAPRLLDLAASGDLTIVKRLGQDIEELVAYAVQANESYLLAGIGLDPIGVGAIVDALADAGIGGDRGDDRVIGISQGYKLNGAIKTAERKLADGTLLHADQALMDWSVGNAKVEAKGNAIVITKQASGTAKIDPLMALLDAVALMSTNPTSRSVDIGEWLKTAVMA